MWGNRTWSCPRLITAQLWIQMLVYNFLSSLKLERKQSVMGPSIPCPPPPFRPQQGRGPDSLAGVYDLLVTSFSLFSFSFVPYASFYIFLQATLAPIWNEIRCKPMVLIWGGNLRPTSKENIDVLVLSDGHWHYEQHTPAPASRCGPLLPFCDYIYVWMHIEDISPQWIFCHILSHNYQWHLKIFEWDALHFIPIYNKI